MIKCLGILDLREDPKDDIEIINCEKIKYLTLEDISSVKTEDGVLIIENNFENEYRDRLRLFIPDYEVNTVFLSNQYEIQPEVKYSMRSLKVTSLAENSSYYSGICYINQKIARQISTHLEDSMSAFDTIHSLVEDLRVFDLDLRSTIWTFGAQEVIETT